MTTGVSTKLAEFVAGAGFPQLGEKTLQQTRYALLDGLGVSLAATTLGEGVAAFQHQSLQQQAAGEARVWGSGQKTSPVLAALANGALAHALDFEDTHEGSVTHPNAAVIPAALAVAEARGDVCGAELLTAIAVGCDVVCRLGLALEVSLDNYGWYPPPILGAFGATAASARLCRLNSAQVLDAFSLTLSQATCSAEIKYNPQSVIRAVRDAFPAQTGVLSAQLAARGVKGFAGPFEGKAGFFAGFARNHYNPAVLTEALGERFEIDNLSFKPWPSCRGTHVFVELLMQLMKENGIVAGDIAAIHTYGNGINRMLFEPRAGKQRPVTAIDAKFSIPFCLARTAVHGPPTLDAFFSESLADTAVLELAGRVHYAVDAEVPDNPAGMTQGRVVVKTRDGRIVEQAGNAAYGCPQRPLREADLLKKFSQCCGYFAKSPSQLEIEALAQSILHLEQATELESALFQYL